jgi:translocator protein
MRRKDGRSELLGIVAIVLATAAVAAAGGAAGDFESRWYRRLKKPDWQPSGAVIGGIWSVLYTGIATAGVLLWSRRTRPEFASVRALFIAQWILNAAWTPLFTRARRLDAALVDCAALTGVNVALVARAWRVRRGAAMLLAPYAVWSAFATFLTWTLLRLNGRSGSAL